MPYLITPNSQIRQLKSLMVATRKDKLNFLKMNPDYLEEWTETNTISARCQALDRGIPDKDIDLSIITYYIGVELNLGT